MLSTKIERRKLKRRGREILDYFLFLRYTLEYLDMVGGGGQNVNIMIWAKLTFHVCVFLELFD